MQVVDVGQSSVDPVLFGVDPVLFSVDPVLFGVDAVHAACMSVVKYA